ncbi:MAG: aminomethyl-transferring glycine dehydrogenase subunit GcvPA [Chlorobi bacterium]|nr:aminomethyl-transferring glycine dehydrogenase subunit GcvPA [Chlorobiota bacterium]
MPFLPGTDIDRKEMLHAIGVSDLEALLANIPEELKLREDLPLPEPLSEVEVLAYLAELAGKNAEISSHACFAGGGAYDHFIPSAISTIVSRSEFLTAYTPYQAEVSQGTLQAIYEYQTMVARLFRMDVSNASMYDGASALAEAVRLAKEVTRRNKVVVAGGLNPNYRSVLHTVAGAAGLEFQNAELTEGTADISSVRSFMNDEIAAIVVQHPNYYGCLEEVRELSRVAHEHGALFIVCADPISLGVLEPPGAYDTDIAVGEGQPLGIPLSFGGPYLGLFCATEKLVRRIPGRLSGMTVDKDGNRGFTLTLQTREQQIRRAKATSNICTNQGLMMLCSTVYMALMGKLGILEVAKLTTQKAHYLADKISGLPGYELMFDKPFFREFVVKTPVSPNVLVETLADRGFLVGPTVTAFRDHGLLIAVTEKRTRQEMDALVEALASV